MLVKSIRSGASFFLASGRIPVRFSSTRKDYYDILGLNKDATTEEIKEAYRGLAKKFHPDVNALGEDHQADAQKFRDVVEAYQVLSVVESRTAYDIQNQSVPDSIFKSQRMEQYRKFTQRDTKTGQPIKEAYPNGSYADYKRKVLAEERKKYNVDILGRYKGGLPQKGKGDLRGSSLGHPGSYHDPYVHNMKSNPDPDTQFVTSRDAQAFKFYQNEDRYAITRRWTWFQATVNYNYFEFNTYREGLRWLRNVLIIAFGLTGSWEILKRSENRSILDKYREAANNGGDVAKGIVVDGHLIKQTRDGVIRIV